MASSREYHARVIDQCHGVCLVVIYYVSPNLGQCHVDYVEIAALDHDTACRTALANFSGE